MFCKMFDQSLGIVHGFLKFKISVKTKYSNQINKVELTLEKTTMHIIRMNGKIFT